MPTIELDGVALYCEEAGRGTPLVLVHEFAGDMRAWEPQMRYFARRHRVIAYNQRGYPPSQVPDADAAYSQDILIEDLVGLLDALEIERAHVAGLATGGNIALNFGIRHPQRTRSLVVAGAGAGTIEREAWLAAARTFAEDIERDGAEGIVANVAQAPQRLAFAAKDPRGYAEFVARMRTLSPRGCAKILRNVLMTRPPVFDLEAGIRALVPPVLVMVGDQDAPALEPARFIARHAPRAGLVVLPRCGHTLNSEEPDAFNRHVADFLAAVDSGRWCGEALPQPAA